MNNSLAISIPHSGSVDPRKLSPEERFINQSAQVNLVRGTHYDFTPPVSATALLCGATSKHTKKNPPVERQFNRGWYIGFVKDEHVFQGKPVGEEDGPDYYFQVSFIGGSIAAPSLDQGQ